jgi:adenylate cyclase
MAVEIERKFLVKNDGWRAEADAGQRCIQGYLLSDGNKVLRVRRIGERAFLTLKGPTLGISRAEFEYEIPVSDAEELLAMCDNRVEKTRYRISFADMIWEVDCFSGTNEGLTLAEIELESEDQSFECPAWLGEEVSGDTRYYNASLARHPFSAWGVE